MHFAAGLLLALLPRTGLFWPRAVAKNCPPTAPLQNYAANKSKTLNGMPNTNFALPGIVGPAGDESMVPKSNAGKPTGVTMQEEAKNRLDRRSLGHLAAKTAAMDFENLVAEPRKKTGNVVWKLRAILTGVLVGMAAGCKGLAEVERLTDAMGKGARRLFNLPARLPDTTAGDVLVRLNCDDLRKVLYQFCNRAYRAKQFVHDMPVRAVVLDGKATSTFLHDAIGAITRFAQVNSATGKALVRTVTACLVTTPARPCLDACPIPAETNECGIYIRALDDLLAAYGRKLFDVVMYDSGAASLANATATVLRMLDYVFILDNFQPTLYAEAVRLLANKALGTADAKHADVAGGELVERYIWVSNKMTGWLDWTHCKTVVRVCCVRTDKTTKAVIVENHYYISSLHYRKLLPLQWIELLRRRWSVENQNHNTFDTIFAEDDRPFLLRPQGMLVVMLLRRIAYNMLAILRSVTTRSETKRATPWREFLQRNYDGLIRASQQTLEGLRRRTAIAS